MSEIPIFVLCEKTVCDIFERTQKFPKSLRMSLTNRIETLLLELMGEVVELRFSGKVGRSQRLMKVERLLLQTRVVIRLAHQLRALDHAGYEHVSRNLDELGRMVGGWRRSEVGP